MRPIYDIKRSSQDFHMLRLAHVYFIHGPSAPQPAEVTEVVGDLCLDCACMRCGRHQHRYQRRQPRLAHGSDHYHPRDRGHRENFGVQTLTASDSN